MSFKTQSFKLTETYSHVNVKMLTRDGLCAYAGCECHWQMERISAGGFRIGYCAEHERRARLLFGTGPVVSPRKLLEALEATA
jgi:hypothetical protein